MNSVVSRRFGAMILVVFFGLIISNVSAQAQVNIVTQHGDNARTGLNAQETILTPSNVNSSNFGKLFSVPVDGFIYAQPLYLNNVSIANGIHNVAYVATEHDSVYAIDADSGAIFWQVSFLNPAAGITTVSNTDVSCTDIVPEIGITATPVIDTATGTIYVVAKTKENGIYRHKLHALDVTTGAEKPGSPVEIVATISGTGDGSVGGTLAFDSKHELNRPGMLLQNGHVIISFASHCDINPYHGWVLSYSANSLSLESVFNDTPSGGLGGIWMSGTGPAGDSSFNTYFASGNGTYDGNPNFSDSVVKLGPPSGSALPVIDWFTPFNQATFNTGDKDLGSGGVLLIPDQPVGSPHQHLLTMAGKSGTIYLIDRDNMGHFQAGSDSQIVQAIPGALTGMWSVPGWWNNHMYIVGAGYSTSVSAPLRQYTFDPGAGLLSTTPTSQSSMSFAFPGPTPVISANGNNNAIVWVIQVNQHAGTAPAVLRAFDATNLTTELYDSQMNDARDNAGPAVKFSVPTVVNGKVYVGTQTQLSVFGQISSFAGITLSPSSVIGGNSSTGTVILNGPAPAAGIRVILTSGNPSVVSVPTSVTVPYGATSATFTITTNPVIVSALVSVTGNYFGVIQSSSLHVDPLLSSVTLNPSAVAGGHAATGAVQLNAAAPTGGIVVNLSSNNPSIASVPATVSVPAGATTATFAVATNVVTSSGSATITALYDSTVTAVLAVNPQASGVAAITLSPTSVVGGVNSIGTVTLNGPAPTGGVLVSLLSNNPLATVPATVLIPADATYAIFTVTTSAVTANATVNIAATFNGLVSTNLTLTAPIFNPIRVNSGGPSYTDSLGQSWLADYGVTGGNTSSAKAATISNTTDPTLYQTARYGAFTYNFTVPNGLYTVTLKFSENYWTAANKRLFNVNINGSTVLSKFDIFAAAGGINVALDKVFNVTATTGTISIQFITGTADNPIVSAVQILSGPTNPDFSLAATPASQAAVQGSGTVYGVTATATGGFNSAVALSLSGLPAGATGTFSPAAIAGSGSSNLSVTTAVSTPPGIYTLTITASSGGLVHTSTVTLVVPYPDFTIAASPASQSVLQGSAGSTTYTATSTTSGSFYSAVALSVSGLPAGATGAFSPTSLNGTGSSTLTVSTSAATPAGFYTLTITGSGGNLLHSTTVALVVSPPDFSISTTPVFQAVVQGSGTTYTATTAVTGGFNSAIGLSVSGLPVAATATFGPTWITGAGLSTMTVSTGASTPAGTYALTIIGTSGNLVHTATATLVVTASSDFSISGSPASQAVAQGSGTTYTTTTAAYGSFNSAIALSVSGLPTGAAGTFSPASITGAGSSTLTVSTTTATPEGIYSLTITGTSGNQVHTTTVTLTVIAPTGGATSIRVGAGAYGYTDTHGLLWNADYGFAGGSMGSTAAAITNTSDPALYQTERYGTFNYDFAAANGTYLITLKFAEIYWTTAELKLHRAASASLMWPSTATQSCRTSIFSSGQAESISRSIRLSR